MKNLMQLGSIAGLSENVLRALETSVNDVRRISLEKIVEHARKSDPSFSIEGDSHIYASSSAYLRSDLSERKERLEEARPSFWTGVPILSVFGFSMIYIYWCFHSLPSNNGWQVFLLGVTTLSAFFSFPFLLAWPYDVLDWRRRRERFVQTGFASSFSCVDFMDVASDVYVMRDEALFCYAQGLERRKRTHKIYYAAIGDVVKKIKKDTISIDIMGKDGKLLLSVNDPVSLTSYDFNASEFRDFLIQKCNL